MGRSSGLQVKVFNGFHPDNAKAIFPQAGIESKPVWYMMYLFTRGGMLWVEGRVEHRCFYEGRNQGITRNSQRRKHRQVRVALIRPSLLNRVFLYIYTPFFHRSSPAEQAESAPVMCRGTHPGLEMKNAKLKWDMVVKETWKACVLFFSGP